MEYKEKYASIGRYPGGFLKREGRASDYEILTSRLVDRVARPLFPDNYHAETFVNVTTIQPTRTTLPTLLPESPHRLHWPSATSPSTAPYRKCAWHEWTGNGAINPTFDRMERADIELMVGATYDNITMVEGEMNEVSETELLEALKVAHEEIKKHCTAQIELMKEAKQGDQARILPPKSTMTNCVPTCARNATTRLTQSQRPEARTSIGATTPSRQSATNTSRLCPK